MIGKYVAKVGMKKLKDKVKGEKEKSKEELDDLDNESSNDLNDEDSNGSESADSEGDSDGGSGDGSESSDQKSNQKNNQKKKKSLSDANTLDIAKVIYKVGIGIGVGVVLLCLIMAAVTMFMTTTGTAVQIIDGSIKTYGEATPSPDKKDSKNGKSNVAYDGDELYTKAKMIVEAVEADPNKKKKVDNISLPNGVPSMWKEEVTSHRAGYYHLVEVEYILREMTKTNFYETYKLSDSTSIKTENIEFAMIASSIQESSFGSGYDEGDNWNKNKSWLEANTWLIKDSYEGPWQMGATYFGDGGYLVFVPSLENSNFGDYGKIGFKKSFKKSDLKYDADDRLGANSSTAFTPGNNSHWHFSDMAATALYAVKWQGVGNRIEEYKKLLKANGMSYEGDVQKYLNAAIFDEVERVPHASAFQFKSDGKKVNSSSSGPVGEALAELAVGGYLTDESMSKLCPKLNNKKQATWKSELCGSSAPVGKATTDRKLGTKTTASDCKNLTEQTFSPLAKLFMSYRIELEVRAVVDAAFTKLGLTLPSGGGGSLQLKETKGEFQGLWSDKTGKTLTSEEMLSYKSSGNAGGQDNAKFVGMKEQSSMKVDYANDPFKDKFGDNVGTIWYHQGYDNAWSKYLTHPGAGKGNDVVQSCCGGYSTAIVLSTMLHRYINLPEVLYAAHSYKARHGGSGCSFTNGFGMFVSENQNMLLNEQMYKNKKVLKATSSGSLSQTEVDKTLKAGGMVIGCFTPPIAAGKGHFVVIRSKDSQGFYYLADPAHNLLRPQKTVNYKFSFNELKSLSKNQVNYVVPGPGYASYISDNSSSGDSSVGSSGATKIASGDYPYWTQGNWGAGTSGKCTCPVAISGGCYVYSLLKIARATGAKFDFASAWSKIQSKGYARSDGLVYDAENILKVCGVNATQKQEAGGKIDFSTKSGRQKLAKKAKEYMDKGYYVIAHIGTKGGAKHFLNISQSDGKTFDVWDSGRTTTTNAGAEVFASSYLHTKYGQETYVHDFRLLKISK